ncbi:P-loop NTPase fold protein [Orbaceae bacterium ac157xtp]
MWSDNETTVDYLNFGIVADACTNLLQQTRGQPISIGISGGWGTGKTSLVKMIESRLKDVEQSKKNNYVFVTFNPWLYQDFDSARSALLQLVGDEILRLASKDEKLKEKALKLLKRINLLRLAQLGGETAATLITGLPIGTIGKAIFSIKGFFNSDDNFKEAEKNTKTAISESANVIKPAKPISLPNEIQAFRNALEELLESLQITLVVFVDDLDRCLPKTAISTLESIRLLLFLKRSAFVIAADNEFIQSAVKFHFEEAEITKEVAINYFDKLIQVPLSVPRLGVNEAKAYLALLLMEQAHQDGKFPLDKFNHALEAIPKRLQSSWRGDAVTTDFLLDLVEKEDLHMSELMKLVEGLAPLLSHSKAVKANPRLMKRFLNTVYLRSALAIPQGIKLDIPALAKWHLLERCNENLANTLAAQVNSASAGRSESLRLAEEAVIEDNGKLPDPFIDNREDGFDNFNKGWLQLAPRLGDTDLRPLLHLSRDTATRDFGSDNMTDEGRSLRDALLSATRSNTQLSQTIQRTSVTQVELAMKSAWQLKAPKRTWRKVEDMLPLTEPCKRYQELGEKASILLSQAPEKEIGPGIIPVLYVCDWAHPIIDKWENSSLVTQPTKRAIQQAKKGGK